MPATYTHYRFGCDVLPKLPIKLHARIDAQRSLFNLGLHGPDLFFYSDPMRSSPINQTGYSTHRLAGQTVFRRFQALSNGSDADFAYLAGYLCHFVLDRLSHDYIKTMVARGISHTLLETQLDRAFLVQDGLDPLRHDLTAHIRPSSRNARVAARFFPQFSEQQLQKAIRSMIFYHNVLSAGSAPKRKLLDAGFRVLGAADTFGAMVMQTEELPQCKAPVAHLQALYAKALPVAASLIEAWPDLSHAEYQFDFNGGHHPQEGAYETDKA